MGFSKDGKDGFLSIQKWERWAFIVAKMGKMGLKSPKDGKDGFQTIKFQKNISRRKKIFFIFRKTCTLEKNCFVKTHLSHHQNPSFPSFAKTHLSRQKMGSGKMGRLKKPIFPIFPEPIFPIFERWVADPSPDQILLDRNRLKMNPEHFHN